ncbi:MAG: hypothetical protein ACP5TK_01765 [Candidatus Micrarchaeia archaeon]
MKNKKSEKKSKQKDRIARRMYIYIAIVVVVVALLAFIALQFTKTPAQAKTAGVQISNLSEMLGASYMPIEVNNITHFSDVLQSEGYLYSSASVYELANSNLSYSYPSYVSFSVLYMDNHSAAENVTESFLADAYANESIRGYIYNNTVTSQYVVDGTDVKIYTIIMIALFNSSQVKSLLTSNATPNVPYYQYTGVFSYKNYSGTVVLNCYDTSGNYVNDTIKISQAILNELARK